MSYFCLNKGAELNNLELVGICPTFVSAHKAIDLGRYTLNKDLSGEGVWIYEYNNCPKLISLDFIRFFQIKEVGRQIVT